MDPTEGWQGDVWSQEEAQTSDPVLGKMWGRSRLGEPGRIKGFMWDVLSVRPCETSRVPRGMSSKWTCLSGAQRMVWGSVHLGSCGESQAAPCEGKASRDSVGDTPNPPQECGCCPGGTWTGQDRHRGPGAGSLEALEA